MTGHRYSLPWSVAVFCGGVREFAAGFPTEDAHIGQAFSVMIAISKFKATCLAVLAEVRKTGIPVRVTRLGEPIAEIVPPRADSDKRWIGCMSDSVEILGDLVGPAGAFDEWGKSRK
jgi:prevent-host-death family protein